jgi:hypothetical protein
MAGYNRRESEMSTLHPVCRERQSLRIAQSKAVMRLVGPLLDAWEGTPNDLKSLIEEQAVSLYEHLETIARAMETPLATNTGDE